MKIQLTIERECAAVQLVILLISGAMYEAVIIHEDGTNSRISYYIPPYKANHSQATLDCQIKFSGRLLSIYDIEIDEFMEFKIYAERLEQEYVGTAGKYNWESEEWEWVTTTDKIHYENWYTGQPAANDNNCIYITGTRATYGWRSSDCSGTHFFICEFTL